MVENIWKCRSEMFFIKTSSSVCGAASDASKQTTSARIAEKELTAWQDDIWKYLCIHVFRNAYIYYLEHVKRNRCLWITIQFRYLGIELHYNYLLTNAFVYSKIAIYEV